ncbi:MAG TPA: hypothetical protein VGQ36_21890 [Thermoanaerobaculia bacterium]|jgi:hypothetical protein|nr:hypothetical protein [Thermoanaerobaculia bacterium]
MLAIAVYFAIFETAFILASSGVMLTLLFSTGTAILVTVILVRFGAVAMAVSQATFLATFLPPAAGNVSWATPLVALPYVVVALAALWAFRTSLGDQSPWHPALLDD